MNCHEFKEQFEDGLSVSRAAELHLQSCGRCETFRSESQQLSRIISSLPKIEAPKDFGFGFKAKLAESKLKKPLSPLWQTLRYLLPLTAAALIFGFVIVNSSLFAPTSSPQIAEKKGDINQKVASTDKALIDETQDVSDELVSDNKDKVLEEAPTEKKEKSITTEEKKAPPEIAENTQKSFEKTDPGEDEILSKEIRPEKKSPDISTRDNAVKPPKIINPRGINPDKPIVNPQMSQTAKSFTAMEILSQLGIETSNEKGRLKVNSIKQNSAGANSGVKVGDVVIAIDGQKITSKPLKNRSVQGKTLRVQRNYKELSITIKNN